MRQRSKKNQGFTIIELLVVIVIVGILVALVAVAYSGVRAKNRNNERQADIDMLQGQLEAYYAQSSTSIYPTYANLNSAVWRAQNLKHVGDDTLLDPRWSKSVAACTSGRKAIAAATPTANCYSYQVTGSDGSACDDIKIPCAHYTLTAVLEGGEKYVKSSLN